MKLFEKIESQYGDIGQAIFGTILVCCAVSAVICWMVTFIYYPFVAAAVPFVILAAFFLHMRLTGGKK